MDELLIAVENLQTIQRRDAHVAASDGGGGDSGETNDSG